MATKPNTVPAKFEEIEFGPDSAMGGVQARLTFANGFGASIICNPYSYGGGEGLYELAVIGPDGGLSYETPITSDVEGNLSEIDVLALLTRIAALTPQVPA